MSSEWPKITADTPLETICEIHQRIWDYVIETGMKPYTPYTSDCVLCEYAWLKWHQAGCPGPAVDEVPRCNFCPAIWVLGEENACCYDRGSPYNKWFPSDHPSYTDACIDAAKQVHDIPFKRKEE